MKSFIIDHIDPLGQGVYKEDDQVFFIPKTLPGEHGYFNIIKRSKGVNFCELVKLTSKSPLRVEPECPHFQECSGCHLLHINYEEELKIKHNNFLKLVLRLCCELPQIAILSSSKRLGYRNRIQLHYDLSLNKLGFKKERSNQIINVAECKIMQNDIKEEYQNLLNNWQQLVKKHRKKQGHLEIYANDDDVRTNWNKAYAHGGFSQVNIEVNQKIKIYISTLNLPKNIKILDLFGGQGNFSSIFQESRSISVDLYGDQRRNKRYFHLDLFKSSSLSEFKNIHKESFDLLIVDPPRSGFKQLSDWVLEYSPTYLLYISCHSATMIRDLSSLINDYKITNLAVADLFPATYHYEGIIFLQKRS